MLFNDRCEMLQRVNVEHHQYYPKAGWVEHDAEEIYANVIAAVKQLMKDADMEASYSMAITNIQYAMPWCGSACVAWTSATN